MILPTQKELREQVRLAKELEPDLIYKDLAKELGISYHGFCNWLSGAFNLNSDHTRKLDELTYDLVP